MLSSLAHVPLAAPPTCTLEDLQEAAVVTQNCSPVVWLENTSVANSIGQVFYLVALHSLLPGTSHEPVVKLARTRTSLRFLRWWQTIRGGKGNAPHSHSEVWSTVALKVSPRERSLPLRPLRTFSPPSFFANVLSPFANVPSRTFSPPSHFANIRSWMLSQLQRVLPPPTLAHVHLGFSHMAAAVES